MLFRHTRCAGTGRFQIERHLLAPDKDCFCEILAEQGKYSLGFWKRAARIVSN